MFFTPALVVSVLEDSHIMQRYIYDLICDHVCRHVRSCMTFLLCFKFVYNKKNIQIFGINMKFISSHETKNVHYIRTWLCHS